MRYALLIYSPPQMGQPSPDEWEAVMSEYNAFTRDVVDAGAMRGGEALEPASTASTVRVRDGKTMVTDGPYAETKEEFGGFYLVEAESIDEAIKWAAKIPGAKQGAIEVRPVIEFAGGVEGVAAAEGATSGSAAG